MTESKAHFRSRSPLIDAPHKPWYSYEERSLIKQRGQQFYCCRLILKSADFIAVLQCRCPLAEAHTPCRNLYAPVSNGKWKRKKGKLLAAAFFQRAVNITFCVTFRHVVTFVIEFFALTKTELQFDFRAFEIE